MRSPRAAVLLILAAAAPAAAVDFGRAAVGTAGSEFLLMDASARGIAMGGAMAAVTDDAASLYWNPAGLAQIPRMSATFMHAQYAADITSDAGAYAARLNDTSVLGAGVRYLDGGSIEQTDINGLAGGTFHPRSYVGEVGWGQSIYDLSDSEMDVAMGVAARVIRTDLGLKTANGYAADFGVQSRFYASALTYDVSAVIQNLGKGQKFDQVRDTLPTRIHLAGAVRPIKPLTLTGEIIAPINNAPYGALGAEWELEIARDVKGSARAGFNSLTMESLGIASTLSLGFGVKLTNLSFDYAFVPMGALGTATHRISLSFNLPAKISRRYRER